MNAHCTFPKPMLGAAVMGIAEQLGLRRAEVHKVLGLSEFECARLFSGRVKLSPEGEIFERIAALFDIHRVLARTTDSIETMKTWIRSENEVLGHAPIELMTSTNGLYQVLHLVGARLPAAQQRRIAACQ